MARDEVRLRKRRLVRGAAGLFVLCLLAGMAVAQEHRLEAWAVAGGGGTSGDGDSNVVVTAGQPAAGAAAGGSYTLSAGFWSLDAGPQPTPVTTPTPRATSTATPTLQATPTPTATFPAGSTPSPTIPLNPMVPAFGRNGVATLVCVAGLFGAALLVGLPPARRKRGNRRKSMAIGATILSTFLCQRGQATAQARQYGAPAPVRNSAQRSLALETLERFVPRARASVMGSRHPISGRVGGKVSQGRFSMTTPRTRTREPRSLSASSTPAAGGSPASSMIRATPGTSPALVLVRDSKQSP